MPLFEYCQYLNLLLFTWQINDDVDVMQAILDLLSTSSPLGNRY